MDIHVNPLRTSVIIISAFLLGQTALVQAQVDLNINREIWKQQFGVLDAQMNEQSPYVGWMSQDDDGDGVKNSAEFTAGTNPFQKLPTEANFHPPTVAMNPTSLLLTFPTVAGKFYVAESSATLVDAWSRGSLPSITGDGTSKTLTVPKSAGNFFHIGVSDQATQGDQVSDWAKISLGLSMGSPITSQTSYTHTTLAANLQTQNVISLSVPDTSGTQAPDASTPATDSGLIRIKRSGYMLLGTITVPLTKSGTAVEGVDYSVLPNSVTFPPYVNSLDIKITPLFNASRNSSATVILTASPPDNSAADGNYTLGNPAFGGITIYPSGNPTGTGLTGNYYSGASSTYNNAANFGGVSATYSYTKTGSTVNATITYTGSPATAFVDGNPVTLQFTSGNLSTSFNTPLVYTIAAPLTTTTFKVNFTAASVASSGTGNLTIGSFVAPLTRLDPLLDFASTTSSFYPPLQTDNFTVRWTGQILPQYSQNYYIVAKADDSLKLWINGQSQIMRRLTNDNPSAVYNYTKLSSTNGSVVVTYTNSIISVGDIVRLNFTLGTLNPSFGISAPYTVTAVSSSNFTVDLNGDSLPNSDLTNLSTCRIDTSDLIIDWQNNTSTDRYCKIPLLAGVPYDIKMEYRENTGSAEAHLSWYSDDQAKQIIPKARLFPTISGTTPLAGNPPAAPPAIISPTSAVTLLGAGTPFTMNLASSNGGTITASGLPPWLTLVNGVLSGTPMAAGIYQFTLTASNSAGTGSSVMTLEVLATGNQLTRDLWTSGVKGPEISDVPWVTIPTTSDTISTAEDNTNYASNTGERLRGYFTVPTTGNYYFWIAAANTAELWISNNSEPVNKVLRSKVTGPVGTAPKTWDTQLTPNQINQKSQWLSLIAGKRYYMEALHNTGSSGSSNNLSIGWFLDPTGTSAVTITTGSGVVPSYIVSPWDNPPTSTIPGTLYVTNLQGLEGLTNITATGGAFLRVNGTSAVLQLNYTGLSSGAVSRKIYNSADQVVFDIDAQDKNYPTLKTTDGGYSWIMQPSDLTYLNNGQLRIQIATINHPSGEITGTFGKTAGSQTAPIVPSYLIWTDLHATSDAANSRFLTQATFGPSPSDMASVKALGYKPWIENQFTIIPNVTPTHILPNVLSNLSNDPQNPYGDTLFFNSWWKNSVTAPDQLRQRAAFALSEILVASDVGPLNNNGRTLADYYDTLLDNCFGNYRDILKQVTLSSAMGVYLDMRGNVAGDIKTGLHPNENYAREIMQLFSSGLYRVWPDGSLVLDSTGSAVPTYDQSVITGMARVFTGWNWGQPLSGGRLPTNTNPSSNYLDPMVLIPTRHELGTKILMNNVVIPAATVVFQSDTSTDSQSNYTVQSTDSALGPGNITTTTITNKYDLNGVKDLETSLDSIMANSATGPYICRQLIQRLVTSHPKPEYVHRVVRAFNGEQNVLGLATGIHGDMKEVFRAILLDSEARSSTAAADTKFGKQREPLLRMTGPARAFPVAGFPNSTYRQLGLQTLLVATPSPHRLLNGDNILLSNFVDSGASSNLLPTSTSYSTNNTTPSYSLVGASGIATINAPGYKAGDVIPIQFTSGTLGTTSPFNTVQNYTVLTASPIDFAININVTTFTGTVTGNAFTPNNFTVNSSPSTSTNYTSTGNSALINGSGYVAGQSVYLKFSSGGLYGSSLDGVYPITSSATNTFTITLASTPPNTSGNVLIPRLTGGYNVTTSGSTSSISFQTSGSHNLSIGDQVQINFLVTNLGTAAQSSIYQVDTVPGPNSFTVITPTTITNGSQSSNGMVAYPLAASYWTRNGTVTVDLSTWNIGKKSDGDFNQTPLNSATVFNFFYPDFQYPGELAKAGMTTPEFQLTNDTNTMNLTNAITQSILGAGNLNGYTSYQNGGGAITMDLSLYMTAAQTSNAGIPALVDTIGTLLTGGNLSNGAKTIIINYVANNTNFPYTTPTNIQMRERVRAIVHLILTSAEYAIQK